MIKGKTKSGFAFEVDEAVAKDARFVRMLTVLQSRKASEVYMAECFFDGVDAVLGVKAAERFLKHHEDENGVAPIDKVMVEFFEIVQKIEEKSDTAKK